jgi:hypothetical protein
MPDILEETRQENLRLQGVIAALSRELAAKEALRLLTLDEYDYLIKHGRGPEGIEAAIDALRDACAFAAHQVNNAPPGAVLKCIGRWRYAIDMVRGRYKVGEDPRSLVQAKPIPR